MEQQQLIPHLFRTEYRKITAVLCKLFGIQHIETAEDLASETFLTAMEIWPWKGIPESPTAWLYTVAKNKAVNYLHRNKTFQRTIVPQLKYACLREENIEIDLSDKNISDSQLQMLFAVCHPVLSTEAQVSLALRVLCGFGTDEIATAFLTGEGTISKRIYRAKEKLKLEKVAIEFPGEAAINSRLEAVLKTLYLLFSEGYYSENRDAVLRNELCLEAMRLAHLLIENEATNLPPVNALYALMCFHASRFEARKNANGEIVLYDDQDEKLWDRGLISKASFHLHEASNGSGLSKYHLEAGIAYWHTIKEDNIQKWENILQLFNHLLQLEYSPVAALNRTYALSKVKGKAVAIAEAEKLKLTSNYFYFVLLGDLYTGVDNNTARINFEKALTLAKTQTGKQMIERKIKDL